MKTLFSILGVVLVFSFAGAQNDNSISKTTDESKILLTWNFTIHNFDKIPLGKPVTASFEFTNESKEPVTITKVRSSCGCTVADYSKEPVLPGKTGKVSATYNAAKPGNFNKSVSIYMSDNTTYRLSIKGTVTKEE
ncbi:MAG: DUF1573 domain-containing protein [Bacteroidales bacterium]|nr:DUF1573 domain-containing protein [Bacteroidales bacterium]